MEILGLIVLATGLVVFIALFWLAKDANVVLRKEVKRLEDNETLYIKDLQKCRTDLRDSGKSKEAEVNRLTQALAEANKLYTDTSKQLREIAQASTLASLDEGVIKSRRKKPRNTNI